MLFSNQRLAKMWGSSPFFGTSFNFIARFRPLVAAALRLGTQLSEVWSGQECPLLHPE
jgi:hypothetical protein